MFKVLTIDLDYIKSGIHLREVNELFFDKVKTSKKVVFGKHHHLIIRDLWDKNDIVLHNVDNHHDIYYIDWQRTDIQNNKSSHGCWVGNLLHSRKLKSYTWYKNIDSTPIKPNEYGAELLLSYPVEFNVNDDNLTEASYLEYDYLFVCDSPEYMVESFKTVYNIYRDYCKINHPEKFKEARITPDVANARITLS